MKRNRSLLIMVQCALLLSIGLAFRYFSPMIPIGGVNGMRISVSGFFTKMPSLLFGPVYGGAVGGLSDFLGWLIRQDEGAYIFPMTLTAALGGVISGLAFRFFRDKEFNIKTDIIYLLISGIFGIISIINLVTIGFAPQSAYGIFLLGLNNSRQFLLTYGCAICCIFAHIFYILNYIVTRHFEKDFAQLYFKILMTLFIAYIPVTTINTFILLWFYPALQKLDFLVVYIPRLIEEIVISLISAYVLAFLYRLYNKLKKRYII